MEFIEQVQKEAVVLLGSRKSTSPAILAAIGCRIMQRIFLNRMIHPCEIDLLCIPHISQKKT